MKLRPQKKRPLLGKLTTLVLALTVVLGVLSAEAQTPPATATGSAPATAPASSAPDQDKQHKVYIGVYVNQLKSIDLKANTFVIDFWIWFRWKGPAAGEGAIHPMDTFEVIGGHIDSKDNPIHDVVKGYNYDSCRVVATVTKFFDIARFPLDAHTLSLNIEDGELEQERLLYEADVKNTALSPDLQVPGWHMDQSRTYVKPFEYNTNYGNIDLETGSKSLYSRFSFQIDLTRPGMGYYFKLFWSLFLATIIALLALLIDPIDLDPRFGLGVGAIFAAIASAYVISSSLPESNQYTLADKLNMLAVGVIFASILQSVFSLRLWKSGREKASQSLDRICFWSMLAVYCVGCAIISLA